MRKTITATLLGGAIIGSLLGAGSASAAPTGGDMMYKVGKDIQPGDYIYTVTGSIIGYGSYRLCSTATCDISDDGLIDIETISGANGTTGYMTVPASAKYVKTYNLALTPN